MVMNFDLKKYINPVFVETGTFHGSGVSRALQAGFKRVISIEVKQEYYEECCEKFSKEIEQGLVTLIYGDSLIMLEKAISGIQEPITFWLDAHNHKGGTGIKSCPLYEELDVIAAHPVQPHTILIDDIRLIDAKGWGQDVQLDAIVTRLRQINENYTIFYENGFQLNDVLVALPSQDLQVSNVNLALNKPAKQSSQSKWSKPDDAEGAVNGIKDGRFGFHTSLEENPWWQVDLKTIHSLEEIHIYNRLDAASDRSRTLQVLLSLDGNHWESLYSNDPNYIFGGINGKALVASLKHTKARFVRLQLNEPNYLHLDEVEIYGSPILEKPGLVNLFLTSGEI